MGKQGWIGVDLDGTLAYYDGWKGPDHIGRPIPLMLGRVQDWIDQGIEVRIFTARATVPEQKVAVQQWLRAVALPDLEITCCKDFGMIALYDDRCVQVEENTGILLGRAK